MEQDKMEYLKGLYDSLGDYELFFVKGYDPDSKKAIAGWTSWKLYSQCNEEEKQQANLRSVFKSEIVLDVEDPRRIDEITSELVGTPCNWLCFETGSRGYHVHILFDELNNMDSSQVTIIKERIIKHFGCDISKKSDRNLIALEHVPHFKTGNVKKLVAAKSGYKNTLKLFTATTTRLKELKLRNPKFKEVFEIEDAWQKWGYPSRSEAEQFLCDILAQEGFDAIEIYAAMMSCKVGKWQEKPESYREITIKKAIEFSNAQPKYIEQLTEGPMFKFFEEYGIPEPITWMVKDYIPAKGVTIIAAAQSSMKSFITQDLIVALLNKRKWLGQFDVKDDRPVILIDMENPHSLIYYRITKLGGVPEKKLIVFNFDGYFDILNQNHANQLFEFIKSFDPCLVVLDTLRRTYSGDENDSRIINQIYVEVLKPISRDRACIILAHKRKTIKNSGFDDEMESIRGTGDITALADSVLNLRYNEDKTLTIKNGKQRGAPVGLTFSVKLVEEIDGKLKFEFLGGAKDFVSEEEVIADTLQAWLQHNKTDKDLISTKEMEDAMVKEGYKRRNIFYAIRILKNKGIIYKSRRGFYSCIFADTTIADFSDEVDGE